MTERNIIKLDSTMIKAHMTCPKMFHYRYGPEHLSPLQPSAPLEFGKAIHSALEDLHNNRDLVQSLKLFMKLYPEDMDKLRTQVCAKAIITDYYAHRKNEFDMDIEIEIGFAFEVRLEDSNDAVLLVGRIDRIRKGFYDPNEVWISDWKTASRIGPSGIAKYVRDIQMGIYYCGATFLLGRCDGVAVDILPVMKKSTAPQMYEYNYSPYEDQVLDVVASEAKQILEHQRTDTWPERWTSCQNYRGCPYQDLCYHNGDTTRIKETLYRYDKWEPWKGILDEEKDNAVRSSKPGSGVGSDSPVRELGDKVSPGVALSPMTSMGSMRLNVSHDIHGGF